MTLDIPVLIQMAWLSQKTWGSKSKRMGLLGNEGELTTMTNIRTRKTATAVIKYQCVKIRPLGRNPKIYLLKSLISLILSLFIDVKRLKNMHTETHKQTRFAICLWRLGGSNSILVRSRSYKEFTRPPASLVHINVNVLICLSVTVFCHLSVFTPMCTHICDVGNYVCQFTR